MEYGKYEETARYFRRMEELAEQLAAADPNALEPQKVKASVKATLADFQLDRIGDAQAALKLFNQALSPSPTMARARTGERRSKARRGEYPRCHRPHPLAAGRPGQGS